ERVGRKGLTKWAHLNRTERCPNGTPAAGRQAHQTRRRGRLDRVARTPAAQPQGAGLGLHEARLQVPVGLVEVSDLACARATHAELALDPRAPELVADDAAGHGEVGPSVRDRRQVSGPRAAEAGAEDGGLGGEDGAGAG